MLGSGRGAVCLRFGAAEEARALSWRIEEVPRRRKRPARRRGEPEDPCVPGWREKAAAEKQEEGGEAVRGRDHLPR